MAGSLSASNVIGDATDPALSAALYDWLQYEGAPTDPINRLAGGPGSISLVSVIGTAGLAVHHGDPRTVSWSGGAPNASGSGNGGLRVSCGATLGNGGQFTVEAGLTLLTLVVYWGVWDCETDIVVSLSDNSAPPVSIFCPYTQWGSAESVHNTTVQFAAASPGQTLLVQMITNNNSSDADIYFQAAGIQAPPPPTPYVAGNFLMV